VLSKPYDYDIEDLPKSLEQEYKKRVLTSTEEDENQELTSEDKFRENIDDQRMQTG